MTKLYIYKFVKYPTFFNAFLQTIYFLYCTHWLDLFARVSRFRNWAATSYRFAFWAGSFHYIRMLGRQATRAEAPILVAASHSTFADTLVIYLKGPPASVAKAEAAAYPLIGSMWKMRDYMFYDLKTKKTETFVCIGMNI